MESLFFHAHRSRPFVLPTCPKKAIQEIAISEAEQRQRNYLAEQGILINTRYPLIRNVHYECAGSIYGSSYDNTVRLVESTLGSTYPREPETKVIDIYIDTPEQTFMLSKHISLRVRLLINEQKLALKLIANMKDTTDMLTAIDGVPFKNETIYLTEVAESIDSKKERVYEYLSSLIATIGNLHVRGIVYKDKIHFTVSPWSFVRSQFADLTMSEVWMNLLVERVYRHRVNFIPLKDFFNMYRHGGGILRFFYGIHANLVCNDFLSREEVGIEIETSRDMQSSKTAVQIIKNLHISDTTFLFTITPKSSFVV